MGGTAYILTLIGRKESLRRDSPAGAETGGKNDAVAFPEDL